MDSKKAARLYKPYLFFKPGDITKNDTIYSQTPFLTEAALWVLLKGISLQNPEVHIRSIAISDPFYNEYHPGRVSLVIKDQAIPVSLGPKALWSHSFQVSWSANAISGVLTYTVGDIVGRNDTYGLLRRRPQGPDYLSQYTEATSGRFDIFKRCPWPPLGTLVYIKNIGFGIITETLGSYAVLQEGTVLSWTTFSLDGHVVEKTMPDRHTYPRSLLCKPQGSLPPWLLPASIAKSQTPAPGTCAQLVKAWRNPEVLSSDPKAHRPPLLPQRSQKM